MLLNAPQKNSNNFEQKRHALVALLSVPPEQLAASNTPVAEMVREQGWHSTTGLGIVSLLAGVNGALVQIIMASRVSYGMTKQGQAPS